MKVLSVTKTIKSGTVRPVAEIYYNNDYIIYAFKGRLSPNDILLKYSSSRSKRLRTPKHIHWAVDLLLKKSGNSYNYINSVVLKATAMIGSKIMANLNRMENIQQSFYLS